ncbi:hypothetical protein [Ornithinimicrobium cerasi]|uniref:hypothetical protein n=1 Tax=Ornithinimicrobium cerasi TaxID=2248773 RepID=UPI000EFEDE50|nr:hypothetical protein [Ornithinimicrobium cerasi]
MLTTTRIQDILLAILCVIAVGLSVLAFRTVNSGGATATPPTTPGATATFGAPDAPTDDAETTEQPDDAATTTTTTGAQADDASVEGWIEAWSGPDADLLVVGDGYSALPEQWVQLWAGGEGTDRPVTIRTWNPTSDNGFADPVRLSEGEGPALRVWNASRPESTVADAAERFARFDDASTDADAVLVSLGQADAAEEVADELDTLLTEVGDLPVLVVVGPDNLYDDGVTDAIGGWAQDNSDRVALVDLSDGLGTQPTADEWAQAFAQALDEGSSAD